MPRFAYRRRGRRSSTRYRRRPARNLVSRFRRRLSKRRTRRSFKPRRAVGFPIVKTVTLKYVDFIEFPGGTNHNGTGPPILPEVLYRLNNPYKPRDANLGSTHQPMNYDQYAMIYQSYKVLRSRMFVTLSPQIVDSGTPVKPVAFVVEPVFPQGQTSGAPAVITSVQNVLENGGRYFSRDLPLSSSQPTKPIMFQTNWSHRGRQTDVGITQAIPWGAGKTSATGGLTDGTANPEPTYVQRITSYGSDDIVASSDGWDFGDCTMKVVIYYTIQFRRGATALRENT